MIKNNFTSLIMFFCSLLVISSCGNNSNNLGKTKGINNKVIKAGVLGDLSGDYVNLFRGIPEGIKFAVEDLNQNSDLEVKIITEDQESCNSEKTSSIINKLINVDQVDFVVGGSCSNTTLIAAPITNRDKTLLISPASSAPSISQAGEYVFRTYISDVFRAKEVIRLVYNQSKRKIAIITDINNDAPIEISRAAKAVFTDLGGLVLGEEGVANTDKDFKTQLIKIKNLKPDALFLSLTSPNQIGIVAKQIKELDWQVQLIVPVETAEDQAVIDIAGNAVEDLIYVVPGNPPHSEKYQELKIRYKEKYNEDEIPMYFLEAYDATMLGVKAVLASDGTKEDIKNKLYEVSKTYQGVSGNVEFDENGDVHKDVMFKTIKDGKFVEYMIGD